MSKQTKQGLFLVVLVVEMENCGIVGRSQVLLVVVFGFTLVEQ